MIYLLMYIDEVLFASFDIDVLQEYKDKHYRYDRQYYITSVEVI